MIAFAWLYLAIALAIGGLFYWRNRSHVDAEFVFLCAGVALLWPIAIALDVRLWWRDRR